MGARQLGQAASVASGFVISGAYPVWSDPGTTPGPLSTTGSVQTGNLARYICHKNVTSLSTSSRCKLSIVYWINIGPYFGFQSCSYYQYLMMLVTQDNRWHAGYPGGRTNAVLKGDRGLFCIWWRDFTDICKFSSFSHGQWPGQSGDCVQGRILSSSVVICPNDLWTLDRGWDTKFISNIKILLNTLCEANLSISVQSMEHSLSGNKAQATQSAQ